MSEGRAFLPYGRQSIGQEERDAILRVLDAPFLTGGPEVDAFESDLAAATGAPHMRVCVNGTAALHLAYRALNIGPDQAVLVPSLTFLATANAVRMAGADVVFCDVDPDTALARVEDYEKAFARAAGANQKPTALVVVHMNGEVAEMPAIADFAAKYGLMVIEDACHALGSRGGDGSKVGSLRYSDAACFSFHPVKTCTSAEGGAIAFKSEAAAQTASQLRNHGMLRPAEDATFRNHLGIAPGEEAPWLYEMRDLGMNYRLPDLLCALGRAQIARLPAFAERRRTLAAQYDALSSELPEWVRPVPHPNSDAVRHLYPLLFDFDALGMRRAEVMAALRDRGVGTQVHYAPVAHQPYYRALYGRLDTPGADHYHRRALSMPLFADMTEADVARVVAAVTELGR